MSYPEAIEWYHRGIKYSERGKVEKAISAYKKALSIWEFKEGWVNLGNCYRETGDDVKAADAYNKSLDSSMPDANMKFWDKYPLGLNNMGLLAYKYGHDDIAIEYYNTAIKADRRVTQAVFNKSLAMLRQCCSLKSDAWMLAWKLYRARFLVDKPVTLRSSRGDLELWDGVTSVDSIVVVAEQGLGDLFMFGRYLPYLKNFTNEIYVQTPYGGGDVFSELGWNVVSDAGASPATHGVPLGELARLFAHNPIPPGDYGRSLLKSGGSGVGFVSRGNPSHANDKNRSYFGNWFANKGYVPLNPLEGSPATTWMETVSLVNSVEYVITVDTSMVHLCGVMGKECYLLQPFADSDFRWGDDSMGTMNVWYPSVKVVRNPMSWEKTFENLEGLIASRKSS